MFFSQGLLLQGSHHHNMQDVEVNHNAHDGFPKLINIPGEEECPAIVKAQEREQRKLNSLSRNIPFPRCYENSINLKNQRRQTKKGFILLSQISSPLISSSCNLPCSAESQLYPNHSWKMLVSSPRFSPSNNALLHITEQSSTAKTGVKQKKGKTKQKTSETKLPQESTWCISGSRQQLDWNKTSLLAPRVRAAPHTIWFPLKILSCRLAVTHWHRHSLEQQSLTISTLETASL